MEGTSRACCKRSTVPNDGSDGPPFSIQLIVVLLTDAFSASCLTDMRLWPRKCTSHLPSWPKYVTVAGSLLGSLRGGGGVRAHHQ